MSAVAEFPESKFRWTPAEEVQRLSARGRRTPRSLGKARLANELVLSPLVDRPLPRGT